MEPHGAADGIEYVIAAIPLGGYVKLLDEREGPVASRGPAARLHARAAVWKRIAVLVAGAGVQFPVCDPGLLDAVDGGRAEPEAGGRRGGTGLHRGPCGTQARTTSSQRVGDKPVATREAALLGDFRGSASAMAR